MAERHCKDGWLKAYREYVRFTEVPDIFGVWAGIFGIAVALGRKCFLVTRPIIYPNLYTVLVAESAWARKSTAIHQVTKLLRLIDNPPRELPQKTTVEALISALKVQDGPIITDKKHGLTTAPPVPQGAEGMIIADELSTFLDRNAFTCGLIAFLTRIWDSDENEFIYETRLHGKEIISNPCLYLLGGTTIDWLKGSIPPEAIGGGFTSRILFVHSGRSPRLIAWPEVSDRVTSQELSLVLDLNRISQLKGEFAVEPEARECFDTLYCTYATNEDHYGETTLRGYAGRRGIFLHKLAMVVSASYNDTLKLTAQDYLQADALLKEIEGKMPLVMRSVLSSADGEKTNEVLLYIKSNGRVPRATLMRRFSHMLNATQMDVTLQTLDQSGVIQVSLEANKCYYTYIGG